jgi:hypothetical protein
MVKLKIDNTGQLQLPLAIRHQLGADTLTAVSFSSGHLLLGRPDTDSPVLLSGCLGEISIPDLLSFFNMFRKSGILCFELAGGSKSLYFQQGEIVSAASTFAREEIGEILFALGKVERDELQRVRKSVRGQMTLGKKLVDQGVVTPKDLWLAARSQVEAIVYNLFTEQAGGYYFQTRSLDHEQVVRLSMSTQNLIMEGLRRLDEKALFMRRIISLEYFPLPTGKLAPELDQSAARLLSFAQGQLNVSELFRKAGLREFDGLRVLHALLEKGLLSMEDAPTADISGDLGEILTIYNSLFKTIHLRMTIPCPNFSQEVSRFLLDLPQPYSFVLREVELQADGSLDGHRVVANLAGLEEGDRTKLLADALCELVFMETMLVRQELEAEQARPLIARVQEITTRVRDLVGGKL